MPKYKNFLGLGIAGNFALHLAQAGELEEFKDIITADEAAPKGIFPFYLPATDTQKKILNAKNILTTYPLSSQYIQLPKENVNVQAEPEVGLVCQLTYKNEKLHTITPTHFGAYNDCSIRVAGANKISDKKNWGKNSKGFSENLMSIDSFDENGVMENYSIASFLRRDSIVHPYGENVELKGYSYFYQKLLDWMTEQITTQEDFGPLEPLKEYIKAIGNPTEAIISIGATRYTEYGEKTFLAIGDTIVIVVYNHKEVSYEEILESLHNEKYDTNKMSVLSQKVI